MASHHHINNHHRQTTTCCCCGGGGSSSSCCSSNPSATTAGDPLLQALATHLLQSQANTHHLYSQSQQYLKSQHLPQQQYHKQQQQQAQSLIQSLLRRVAALESSLPHPSPPPPAPAPAPAHATAKPSLRDLAARTIQARFRLYLVRRSQTLRHLKHLASIRSHLANLKSSIPEEDHLSPKALSQRAMDLLLQLDSIQSGDPMIREGKRSISRELVRLLDFADRVSVRKQEQRLHAMEVAENGSERRALMEKSNRGVEEAGDFSRVCEEEEDGEAMESLTREMPPSKPVKKVSFAVNTEECRGNHEHGFDHLGSGNGQTAFMEELLRETNGFEGFVRVSENAKNLGKSLNSRAEHKMGGYQNGNLHLGLSAPMPVQMENRSDSKKKKKNVVIAS